MNKGSGQDIKQMMYKATFLKDNKEKNDTMEATLKKSNENLDLFLEKNKEKQKKESWNRLSKTVKFKKIDDYVDNMKENYNLNEDEKKMLKLYLNDCIERKRLLTVKDVIYDKLTGKIKSIPCFIFNTNTRAYTLKKTDKRVSTLKSLGVGRKKVVINEIDKQKEPIVENDNENENDNDADNKIETIHENKE